jgi:hypothetical protein
VWEQASWVQLVVKGEWSYFLDPSPLGILPA